MIENTLKKIGLSDKETKVYLVSLRLGVQPASNIARRTKISRASVYDIFNNLIKKGLANKQDKAGITVFEVQPPENLLNFLEQEKQAFIKEKEHEKRAIAEILPLLKSIQIEKTTKPKVKFFEGKKGLREAYSETLKTQSPIRAYANVQTMHEGLPDFFPKYYESRAAGNIFIRAIAPNNQAGRDRSEKDQQEAREMKFINEDLFEFTPEMNIFDDKILYSSWKEKLAILIESEEIADFHKKMFDLLWSKLK